MKNAWGYTIPPIEEILTRSELKNLISDVTNKMLRAIGESPSTTNDVIRLLFDKKRARDIFALERLLHSKLVLKKADEEHLQNGMRERAQIIFRQIEKYLQGTSLADVGCGHGLVSWAARKYFSDILLLDIVDYRAKEAKLPFIKYSQRESPPFGRSFDCTLLITVLHHAVAPSELLTKVWESTSRRLIVIESVFGVDVSQTNSPLPSLDQSTQLCYAAFCDWLYNRVLNQGISVPYNFNTPENWRQIFSQLPARIAAETDLGVDLDIVPEHHFLFVLDKAVA